MLTRLRRRTSPTHPYPTVTYGEWYDFHDVSSLMSPSPSLTFKVSFCLVCRVHQSHHNYTGPPRCMAVSPKGSLIFSFSSKPYGAGSNAAQKFQMVTGFKWTVHLIRVAHRSKSIVIFSFESKLKSLEKLSSQPHTRTLKSSPGLSVMSCQHIHYITCRWWLGRHQCDAIN